MTARVDTGPRTLATCALAALVMVLAVPAGRAQSLASCQIPVTSPQSVVPKGERILGIALTSAKNAQDPSLRSDGAAFHIASAAGSTAVEINVDWRTFEAQPRQYADDRNTLADANALYADADAIILNITPFQTCYDARPPDLAGLPWDDESVAIRYARMIDWVLTQIPALEPKVYNVTIGNEILFNEHAEWKEYARFLKAAHIYVKALWHVRNPGQEVQTSVKIGLEFIYSPWEPRLAELWAVTDAINVSHYFMDPVSARAPDPALPGALSDVPTFMNWIDTHAALAGKKVLFSETGYATHPALNTTNTASGECSQARFVQEIFAMWDRYPDRLSFLGVSWLNDLTADGLPTGFMQSCGWTPEAVGQNVYDDMLRWFGSLGLRTPEGVNKPGFEQLVIESCLRGFTECPM